MPSVSQLVSPEPIAQDLSVWYNPSVCRPYSRSPSIAGNPPGVGRSPEDVPVGVDD